MACNVASSHGESERLEKEPANVGTAGAMLLHRGRLDREERTKVKPASGLDY